MRYKTGNPITTQPDKFISGHSPTFKLVLLAIVVLLSLRMQYLHEENLASKPPLVPYKTTPAYTSPCSDIDPHC